MSLITHLEEQIEYREAQIKELWEMLDNISTAGDAFKPEINDYFKYVNKECERRNNIAYSPDGHKIIIRNQF